MLDVEQAGDRLVVVCAGVMWCGVPVVKIAVRMSVLLWWPLVM